MPGRCSRVTSHSRDLRSRASDVITGDRDVITPEDSDVITRHHDVTRVCHLRDVNHHLQCVLCRGYLIEACTITECLHSFCKTCIVRYLESSKFCPVCDVLVHEAKPLINVREDKLLQSLVYKLVPGLLTREIQSKLEYQDGKPQDSLFDVKPALPITTAVSKLNNATISLALHFSPDGNPEERCHRRRRKIRTPRYLLPAGEARYLLCPALITVRHLQKFIRSKFTIPPCYQVSVLLGHVALAPTFTLLDVAYMADWTQTKPLLLYYTAYRVLMKSTPRRPGQGHRGETGCKRTAQGQGYRDDTGCKRIPQGHGTQSRSKRTVPGQGGVFQSVSGRRVHWKDQQPIRALTPPSSSSLNDSPGSSSTSPTISGSSSSGSSSPSSPSSASSSSSCLPASSSSHGKTDSDVTSGCGAARADLPHQKSVRIKRKLNKPSRRCSEHAVNEFRYHRIGGTATIKREEAEVVSRQEVVPRQEVVGRPEVQLGSLSQHVRRPEKKLLVSIPLKKDFPLLDHIKKEPDDQTYRKSCDIHSARNGSSSLNHDLEVKKEPPESTGRFECMFGRYSDSGHESDSDAIPRLLIRRDHNIYVSESD